MPSATTPRGISFPVEVDLFDPLLVFEQMATTADTAITVVAEAAQAAHSRADQGVTNAAAAQTTANTARTEAAAAHTAANNAQATANGRAQVRQATAANAVALSNQHPNDIIWVP